MPSRKKTADKPQAKAQGKPKAKAAAKAKRAPATRPKKGAAFVLVTFSFLAKTPVLPVTDPYLKVGGDHH